MNYKTAHMPAAKRAFKSHGKPKPRDPPPRRDLTKFRRKKAARPRTSPSARPNEYRFTRRFSSTHKLGTTSGQWLMNTDDKYQIIKLVTSFNNLPDYTEFNALFSEYKIHSFSIKLIPYQSANQLALLDSSDSVVAAPLPNYEVFEIPVNFTDDAPDLSSKTGDDLEDFLNQSQRLRRKMMPRGVQSYFVKHPKVMKFIGSINKTVDTSATKAMGSPGWLSTDNSTSPNETNVNHYGIQLAIRRVDGLAMNIGSFQTMGFRVEHQINFSCRKVQ